MPSKEQQHATLLNSPVTLHAKIANAAVEVAVALRDPSSLPYVSMMLSAVKDASAAVVAAASLQDSQLGFAALELLLVRNCWLDSTKVQQSSTRCMRQLMGSIAGVCQRD